MQRNILPQRCLSTVPGIIAPGRAPLPCIHYPIVQQRRQLAVRSVNPEDCDASTSSAQTPAPHHHALTRRDTALLSLCSVAAAAIPDQPPASAVGFTNKLKKRKLTEDDYVMSEDVGLRIVELEEGSGNERIKAGDKATVHYDCTFRGIDAVSSRAARLLGGNRIIAEPYEFVVGEPVLGMALKKVDADTGGNGLFAGTSGPKPPQALSRAPIGMKRGGRRSVLVDNPELGYPKGMLEIPAGATFELKVEVLSFSPRSA
ncbi:FK506 binding protein [Dunaliella salina]|uniref:peptidylprolyl isomerase n=1 Tax=Dunaliella salina TaxID=3046 RepID=A0ABQ7G0E0_DUNSA|nr:FK506 binding protein [Dunaliella salina]|eukprot:KAF5828072.1 FK506 binding protein [Dunaliella salina]